VIAQGHIHSEPFLGARLVVNFCVRSLVNLSDPVLLVDQRGGDRVSGPH